MDAASAQYEPHHVPEFYSTVQISTQMSPSNMPKVPTIPRSGFEGDQEHQGDSGNSRLFVNQGYA